MSGLLVAAPSSGSGKTIVTLALLRALRNSGLAVASAKAGPDYIDPAFHAAAAAKPCVNLDPWAMRDPLLRTLGQEAQAGTDAFVVEAMMGLFDGAADGKGSAADLAARLDLRILLVVDCARQSHSVAALVRGFRDHRSDAPLAGLLLNRVGSARHEAMLREALSPTGVPILGALGARPDLVMPSRHLGLVQAGEQAGLEAFIEAAAEWLAAGADLGRLADLARPVARDAMPAERLAPLGQNIAVARDTAFAFAYPHLLDGWRQAGASLRFFSPLADEGPAADCDAVYLPGGYPELHAGALANAARFRSGVQAAAARGALVYGECGGYMVLGEGLVDAEGRRHPALGLLPLETSFAERRRHLGYRRMVAPAGLPWAEPLTGHEFHYATVLREEGAPLFEASDALGTRLSPQGLRLGNVAGSFLHVIDRAD